MQGALKIFSLANIPVYVHWSFSLLAFFLLYYGWYAQMDGISFLIFLVLFFALFLSVILHEYGHALTARYYGVKTKDIILLPIGGLARLEKLPKKPLQEFVVAAAGPVVNLFIAGLLGIILWFEYNGEIGRIFSNRGTLILRWHRVIPMLFVLNLSLVIMNLIPAFPLDGGRMLRATLAIKLGRLRATQIASYLGQGFSVLLVGYGIYYKDFMSMLLGFFLFSMARKEYRFLKTENILSSYLIGSTMKKTFPALYTNDSVTEFLATLTTKQQGDFLVLSAVDQSFYGILSAGTIKKLRNKNNDGLLIGAVTESNYPVLSPAQNVADGLSVLRSVALDFLPVLQGEEFMGVLDYDSINELLKTKTN